MGMNTSYEIDWLQGQLRGRWWDTDKPSDVVGGVLYRTEKNMLRLELLDWFREWDANRPLHVNMDGHRISDIIHGEVKGRPITLLGCKYLGSRVRNDGRPYDITIRPEKTFGGLHVGKDPRFAYASVSMSYLNEWADRPTDDVSGDNRYAERHFAANLGFAYDEPLEARVSGATISLDRQWTTRYSHYLGGSIESHEVLSFVFEKPIDVESILHDYVRPIQNLVTLASRDRSQIEELRVSLQRRHDEDAVVLPNGQPNATTGTRYIDQSLLFRQHDLGFSESIERWFDLHVNLDIVCDLLASLRGEINLANQFMNAASALESYHRRSSPKQRPSEQHKARLDRIISSVANDDKAWLRDKLRYSHEPTYLERLSDLLAIASPLINEVIPRSEVWARWLKDARNSVAHRDPGMVSIEKEWRAAAAVVAAAEWLLVILLMLDLGFTQEEVRQRLQRNPMWQGLPRWLDRVLS